MADQQIVTRAIESYEPAWLPPERELHRLVVVIDALWQDPRDHWRANHLALLTAEHLYHLIQRGGGVPVLTRADDSPSATIEELEQRCDQSRCHAVLSIAFRETGRDLPATRPAGRHALAGSLASALGASSAPASARYPVDELEVPAAVLEFPLPQKDDARPLHRTCARTIYDGLARFSRENHDKLDTARRRRWSDAPTTTSQPVPFYGVEPQGRSGRIARQIWPAGDLPVEQVGWFCDMYRRIALSDRTAIYFEPQVTQEEGKVVLRGATTIPLFVEGLITALRGAGIEDVRDEIRVLPEAADLGDRAFGACSAPMARTFVHPDEASGPQTQLLFGEPVFLLDRRDGHFLLQGGDGYWGWVREEAIRPMTRREFRQYTAPQQAVLLRDVRHGDGWVRRGTRLPLVSSQNGTCTLATPDGKTLRAESADVHVADHDWAMDRRVAAALKMLYTPYVFGARSPVGLDCSGLIENLIEQEGGAAARDAAQQFLSGKLVATRWYRDDLRPGDRVYFGNVTGKISHTGLMISPTHFIHSSPPEVQISSLQKGDRLYSQHWDECFLGAKRP